MRHHEIIIMAKSPFCGKVKTRLAKTIGQQAAQGVYTRLLYSNLINLSKYNRENTTISLYLTTSSGKPYFKEAFPEMEIQLQSKGNIGDRMHNAFQHAFTHGADSAVLIGSDIQEIKWSILDQAFEQIYKNTIVIGPTFDQGYYLVGMKAPGIDIFQNIVWSTDTVLENTTRNIEKQGFKVKLLPTREDIDEESDLRRWQAGLSKQHDFNVS